MDEVTGFSDGEHQQKHISLRRQKEISCTISVGFRLIGIKKSTFLKRKSGFNALAP
jgi:hypothetical protein